MFCLALTQVVPWTTCLIFLKNNQSAIYYICSSNSSRYSVTKITTTSAEAARSCPHLLSRSSLPLRGQSK